jgi:flagellar hook-length control protein FliK
VVADPDLTDVLGIDTAEQADLELPVEATEAGSTPETEPAKETARGPGTKAAPVREGAEAEALRVAPGEASPQSAESRAAIDMAQAGRASALPAPGTPLAESAEPVPPTESTAVPEGPALEPTAGEATAGGDEAPEREPFARPGAAQPAPAAERSQPAAERAFDVARVADRRAPRAEAPQPPQAPRQPAPLPPERAADVLRQVRLHLAPGLREATVRLQPAWLGRIAIRIALRDGRTTAEVRAESKSTLEALERHVPELRAALEQHGIEAGELELRLGLEQGPGEDRREFGAPHGGGRTVTLSSPEPNPAQHDRVVRPSRTGTEGGVDTYA